MRSLKWALVLVLGLLLPRAAALVPRATEILYSRGIFRGIGTVLGRLSGLVRIDLAVILVSLAVLGLGLWLCAAIARSIRKRSLRYGFASLHRVMASPPSAVWAFCLAWGLNYTRPPLATRLSLTKVEPDADRLGRLTRLLAAETNRSYEWARSDDQIAGTGSSSLRIPRAEIAERIAAAYAILEPGNGAIPCSFPKSSSVANFILTRIGISGFYFPYTGEATVNAVMPQASLPFVMAHEMAHQRGTAREDEANFLAYLACHESGLASARYSGALAAFGLAFNALWQASPDSARAVREILDAGPRADRAAIHAFWQRHEGRASALAERVNDRYLKANAQRAGTGSYDLAVELLVAYAEVGGFEEEEGP